MPCYGFLEHHLLLYKMWKYAALASINFYIVPFLIEWLSSLSLVMTQGRPADRWFPENICQLVMNTFRYFHDDNHMSPFHLIIAFMSSWVPRHYYLVP